MFKSPHHVRKVRIGAVIVGCCLVLGLLLPTLHLSDTRAAPLLAGSLSLSPPSGPPGSTVTVSGSGWGAANDPYNIIWDDIEDGPVLGTFSAGSFSVDVTIPGGASVGNHTIYACAGHGTEFQTCNSKPFNVTAPATNTPIPPTFTPTFTFTPSPTPTATFTPTPTLEECIDSITILSPDRGEDLGGVETTDMVVEVIYGRDEPPEVEFYGNNRFNPYTQWPDPEEGTTVAVEEDPTNPHRYVFTVRDLPISRGRNEVKAELSRTCSYPRHTFSFQNGIPFTSTPRPDMCGGISFGEDTEIITFNYTGPLRGFRNNVRDDYGVVFGRLFDLYRPESINPLSGRFAGSSIPGMEFGHTLHPIRMTFLDPLTAVGTYVGLEEIIDVDSEVTAILSVYGLEGGEGEVVLLGSDSTSFPPEPTDIKHCLNFEAEDGDLITQALLEYEDENGSIAERRLMDDLTILRAEETAIEDQPPQITINNPEEGATVESSDLVARAEIIEDREITKVWTRLNEGDWVEVPFSPHTSHPAKYLVASSLPSGELLYGTENTLEVRAEDNAGQQNTDQVRFEIAGEGSFTLHDLDYDLTQHGVFDIEGFPDFLVAGKTGVMRVTGIPQIGGRVTPVTFSESQLWWTRLGGRENWTLGYERVGNEFEYVRPLSGGELDLYFFVDGSTLDPGIYIFDLLLKSRGEIVHRERLGGANFHSIPTQYQFYAIMEDPLTGVHGAGFNKQLAAMPRVYPVKDGSAEFGSRSSGSKTPGIIYEVARSVIPLPNGKNPYTGEESFAWDFIHDGPGDRARAATAKDDDIDCNLDGEVNEEDKRSKWLLGEDGEFKPGTIDPPGHLQWDWGKPEDVNGDGIFSQDEIGLWVVEFLDLDGDGEWHDYIGSARDQFTPGDPFHTYKDKNRNCEMDDDEKSSMLPGTRRKSNAWGYMRQQTEMLRDEFAAIHGLERMVASAIVPGPRTSTFNVRGNCPASTICWANSNTQSMVIAHEIGHGWGLDHDNPVRIPGGGVNLKEQRWIPDGEARNYMYKNMGNNPRENFSSASRFEQLFNRGLGGWHYHDGSSTARESGGNLLALQRRVTQGEKEATFALYGQILEDGKLRIDNTRVFHQALGPVPEPGSYRLVFLNQAGEVLSETSFGVIEEAICDGCPDDEETVTFEFPYVSVHAPYPLETETLKIYHEDQLLHSIEVSLRAPDVVWTAPESGKFQRDQPVTLRWNGEDEDEDSLTYNLAYSSDGGRTFTPIATGLQRTAYEWQPHTAAGSQEGIFRVTANDGFHTATAQSPLLTLEKGSPLVTIISPQEGQEIGHRSRMVFEATAVDPEDGTLSGDAVIWTDSTGETIGSGTRVVLDGYQQGEQSFTVTAQDTDGNQTSQTLTVIVVQSSPLPETKVMEEIAIESSAHTLAIGDCEPSSSTIQATFPEDLEITSATLLIDRMGQSGTPLTMAQTSGNTFTAELSVTEAGIGAWQVAAYAEGEFGEAWSTPSTLEIVSCEPGSRDDTADTPDAGLGLSFSRVLLIMGAGILILIVLGTSLFLVQRISSGEN